MTSQVDQDEDVVKCMVKSQSPSLPQAVGYDALP